MLVVAVVNRKGGSGKSTLATHLAGYLANRGAAVMLGDVDRQQSIAPWLRRRGDHSLPAVPILGWTVDPKNVLRPSAQVSHVVLDTPGGLQGLDLARIVMSADVVLMPVCNSAFDRESAASGYAELCRLPRIASGRCKVAAVGMRIDSRTSGRQKLEDWAQALQLPFIGVLRETQTYVRCVERGLTLFDLPASRVQADLAQWQPILDWLAPLLEAAAASEPAPRRASAPASAVRPTRPCLNSGSAHLPPVARPQPPPAVAPTGLRKLFAWLLPPRTMPLRARP